jgi:2-hydroxychromene-2-carboxylate isomerase
MQIEFWYEFASTYSYPAVERVAERMAAAGHALVLRPFLLGPIFAAQGWSDSPFNLYPAKGRYMWRDLERICSGHGLSFQRPSVFPRNGLHAARIALSGQAERWCYEFSRSVYRANFRDDLDISDFAVLTRLLEELGLNATEVIARSRQDAVKQALREQTDRAVELGIFGAPTYVVAGELFWGDDRLDAALDWAREHGE